MTAATCKLCGLPARRRCRICARGNWPRPGSRIWVAWARGLSLTIRHRLTRAGLVAFAVDAVEALYHGDNFAAEIGPLLADIACLPVSVRMYQLFERRALLRDSLYRKLLAHGVAPSQADKTAENVSDRWLEEQLAPRRVEPALTGLLVEASRLCTIDEETQAELEAAAAEEARRAVR